MQPTTTAQAEEATIFHEPGSLENIERHKMHDIDEISMTPMTIPVGQSSATLPKPLDSNMVDQGTEQHSAKAGLSNRTAHQPLSNSLRQGNTLEVGVPHSLDRPDHQTIPSGNTRISPSLNISPFATAIPLANHHTPPILTRGPCETSGAVLINNDWSKTPITLHGGRGGKKGSRLSPRTPVLKKKKPSATNGRSSQTARRGNGFTQNETESILELLEEHLPLAKEEWEKVTRLHELRYPQQNRNTDSILRKFSALFRTVPPTGDPSIPSDVLKAREIRKAMTERADIGCGEDSEDEYIEEMNDQIDAALDSGTATRSGSVPNVTPDTQPEITEELQAIKNGPSATQSTNPSPRPLVRKRAAAPMNDDESIMSALKASLVQEQMRREEDFRQRMLDKEEEKKRREEERHIREQERLDDRERRAEERQRSDRMMQMMFVALLGPRAGSVFTDDNSQSKDT